MFKTVKPTRKQILVEPLYDTTAKVGSIHIPEKSREDAPQEAVIIAVGPLAKIDASPGQRVIVERYGGKWIDIAGRRHRLLEPDAILAVVEQPGLA